MKYLLITIAMGTLALVSVPTLADSGIAINATTIIVGNGGSNGNFDSGGSYTYGPPDWTSQFPSMNQQPQSSATGYIPPVQQPIYIPPVINSQSNQYTPVAPATPATPSNPVSKMDWIVLFIILGIAGLVGLVVWIISKFTDNYKEEES